MYIIILQDFFLTVLTMDEKYRKTCPPVNMDWIVYMLFARQEYVSCKNIIDQQLRVVGVKEYLYFIKV